MKWFKHEAKKNAALKRLLMEYSALGYGVYWYCIELISSDISQDNLTFELEEDTELIAYELNMELNKLEEILWRCIELGLFDISDSGRLRCLALAKGLDETTSKNPIVKEIKDILIQQKIIPSQNKKKTGTFKESSGASPEEIRKVSGEAPSQIRLDKIRLEENRIEAAIITGTPSLVSLQGREHAEGVIGGVVCNNSPPALTNFKQKKVAKSKNFIKPEVSEIKKYCKEKKLYIDVNAFYDYYESNGWYVGKKKMKDWKAAVRNWNRREQEFKKPDPLDKLVDELTS
jgi:hypothetical protein